LSPDGLANHNLDRTLGDFPLAHDDDVGAHCLEVIDLGVEMGASNVFQRRICLPGILNDRPGLVDIPFSQTTSLQLDLGGEATFSQGSDSTSANDNYAGNLTLGAHLNYRQVDRYLFGVFGGGGSSFHKDTGTTGQPAPFWFVGLEGQAYFGNSTLYGQAGYLDSNQPEPETLETAWFVRAVDRHFFNAGQTKAEGELSYGQQDEGSDSVNIFGWGLELEHQCWSFGNDGFLAGYVRYEGRHFNETTQSDNYTEHTLMVGLKADMNQMNLLSRDRTGATLDLPNFGRWVGGTITLD
jgi:hypothetical protein